MSMNNPLKPLTPAKAGASARKNSTLLNQIPACAGMIGGY